MIKLKESLWVRKVSSSLKQVTYRPLVPEYEEPRKTYRQSTNYSNTY